MREITQEFPILQHKVRGKRLVYLDNAATTQKPRAVIQAEKNYYETMNANVHRAVHYLSEKATSSFERARERVARFIGAPLAEECIFTKGATESMNLLAQTFCEAFVKPGDEVLISAMEHHSNIVPWQIMAQKRQFHLRIIPMNTKGELLMDEYKKLLTPKVKLVSLVHVSNSLGTINPVKEMICEAHALDIPVHLDGAQALAHLPVDMVDLDCDFYSISSHKFYGPTGAGVLYGKKSWLDKLPPYQGGGDMILSVTFEKTTYNKTPHKFEAGTPNIAGVIGMAAALDFLDQVGMPAIEAHEAQITKYAVEKLAQVEGLRFVGEAANRTSIVSFVLEGIHPHDIGTVLDQEGVAVRTGHHCTQPVMDFFKVPATARASFGLYNSFDDVDALVAGLHSVKKVFRR